MQGILDSPVRPDSLGEKLCAILDTGNEVSAFQGGLPFACHLGNHSANGFKPFPLLGIGDSIQKGGGKIGTTLMTTMAVLFGLMEIKVRAIQILRLYLDEGLFNLIQQGTLIAFEAPNVITFLFNDLPGNLFLATHGINSHYASIDIEHLEQFGDGSDLIGVSAVFPMQREWKQKRVAKPGGEFTV